MLAYKAKTAKDRNGCINSHQQFITDLGLPQMQLKVGSRKYVGLRNICFSLYSILILKQQYHRLRNHTFLASYGIGFFVGSGFDGDVLRIGAQ